MPSTEAKAEKAAVVLRKPTLEDAASIHALVDECKPLDLNSAYAYMLLCTHFADTCSVAESDGRIVGFLSAYRKPNDESVLFIWQIAVSTTVRGRGVGRKLLDEVFERPSKKTASYIEATITPSNRASWALFESFAKKHGAPRADHTLFTEGDFGDHGHEKEQLLRIGPLPTPGGVSR